MAGFRGKFAGAFLGLAVLTAGLLISAGPAGAFWGDYGEAPPEFFGVRLGDDIRDYPDMLPLYPDDGDAGLFDYYREADSNATIAGVAVQNNLIRERPLYIFYRTYKNKVYEIGFPVLLEDFEKVRQYLTTVYGVTHIPENTNEIYRWGLYEVSIEAHGHFPIPGNTEESISAANFAADERERDGRAYIRIYVEYQPIINALRKDQFNNFKARYRGVRLGGKVENYAFLRAYKQEAPGLTYYHSSKPLGLVRGLPVIAEDYIAYQGVIYRIVITSDKWVTWEGHDPMSLGDLVRDRYSSHLFNEDRFVGLKHLYAGGPWFDSIGDSEYIIVDDYIIYTHMPTYWRAMRAKVAYHRNVKPD